MVDAQLLKQITDKVMFLCKQKDLKLDLKAENVYDNECVVNIPEDGARLYDEYLAEISEDLKDIPGIKAVYDAGRGMYRSDGYRAFEIQVADGYWTHTKADEDAEEEDMRQYFDADYIKEQEAKRREKRLKNWKEHLLPIPKAPKGATEEAYLVMAYEPFEWIKNGEKDTEFRAYSERYVAKLLSRPIKRVKLQKGYGGPGRPKPEQMVFEVKGITLYDITTGNETDPFNPNPILPTHIAIGLGKRIS